MPSMLIHALSWLKGAGPEVAEGHKGILWHMSQRYMDQEREIRFEMYEARNEDV